MEWQRVTFLLHCLLNISTYFELTDSKKPSKAFIPQIFSRDNFIRTKRATSLSAAEIKSVVDKHNDLRRQEGSSDMQKLIWNDYLADMAQDWAEGCDWQHGQPYRDPATMPYNPLGQNLYVTSGSVIDVADATQLWYDEIYDYHFDNNTCDAGKVCGHYTQVVWASSLEVGCGYAFCQTVTSISGYTNSILLVCNYGPAGNYAGKSPYTKGTSCTQCPSGQGWCDNGLCNTECTAEGAQCDCSSNCENCGTLDSATCTCKCADGWYGADCSIECTDKHANCNANPGWPPSWCDQEYVVQGCPLMCGKCKPAPTNRVTCETTTSKKVVTSSETTTASPAPVTTVVTSVTTVVTSVTTTRPNDTMYSQPSTVSTSHGQPVTSTASKKTTSSTTTTPAITQIRIGGTVTARSNEAPLPIPTWAVVVLFVAGVVCLAALIGVLCKSMFATKSVAGTVYQSQPPSGPWYTQSYKNLYYIPRTQTSFQNPNTHRFSQGQQTPRGYYPGRQYPYSWI